MGSENQPVRQSGIYHNLPQFDPSIKDLTAIVTGANGISGFHTCRALLDSPHRWKKIYAMSRRPPPEDMMNLLTPEQRGKIEHVASDFLKEPEELADAMKKAGVDEVDYVFFYSYLQPKPPPNSPPWSNAEELVKVNSALLRNFLGALDICKLNLKRFLLRSVEYSGVTCRKAIITVFPTQLEEILGILVCRGMLTLGKTGAKNFGVHLGRARVPCLESDPQPKHLEPNFYYPQEDLLFEYCKNHPGVDWNIIMPAWIIGATSNAQMNALHPFAVYAAVRAHLNEPLIFPGDWDSWQADCHHSSARLTGYLSEWAILEPKCANTRFNSQDTSPVSWDRYFERLAAWFGVAKGVQGPPDTLEGYGITTNKGGKDTPMGYGPPAEARFKFTLSSWAREEGNRKAWREIMEGSGGRVKHDPFEDVEANFSFGDGAFMRVGCLGMGRARRMGWTGFVDTVEAVHEMYSEMGGNGKGGLGMVPEMKVKDALPLI